MLGLEVETEMRAGASFEVGNRVFHVVSEVRTMKALGGKLRGIVITPVALLVEEEGEVYSTSLTGEKAVVEDVLRLIPELRRASGASKSVTSNSGTVAPR